MLGIVQLVDTGSWTPRRDCHLAIPVLAVPAWTHQDRLPKLHHACVYSMEMLVKGAGPAASVIHCNPASSPTRRRIPTYRSAELSKALTSKARMKAGNI
jgi:hypothetical protein